MNAAQRANLFAKMAELTSPTHVKDMLDKEVAHISALTKLARDGYINHRSKYTGEERRGTDASGLPRIGNTASERRARRKVKNDTP